jgi:ubiquinone/menaquinone biosynthesis C-methylase UbiE
MTIPGSKRLFAWLVAHGTAAYEARMAGRKRRLLGGLGGLVVEIGPGAGVNLRYLPPGVTWVGVEPNPHMRPYLEEATRRAGVPLDLREGSAERLPLETASVDAVVATLVLCSVDDVAAALGEIRRVLKPGGRFVFIEHVAAAPGTLRRRLQRWVRPFWRAIGDGCHPDRETLRAIRAAGFDRVEAEEFRVPAGLVAPHVAGTAFMKASSA